MDPFGTKFSTTRLTLLTILCLGFGQGVVGRKTKSENQMETYKIQTEKLVNQIGFFWGGGEQNSVFGLIFGSHELSF